MMNSAIPRFRVLVAAKQRSDTAAGEQDVNRTFVSSLFQLLVLSGLLHKLKDLRKP